MALCGYNKTMLDALTSFGKGLWDQLLIRAEQEQKSLSETLQIEIDEMEIYIESLGEERSVADAKGVAYLAQFLYQTCLMHGASKEAYDACLRMSVQRQSDMDNLYYDTLRPQHGAVNGLQMLSDWLKQHPISVE